MAQENGICAIVPCGQNGFRPHVHGMGILVNDREVVTCAHVIDIALGPGWEKSSGQAVVRVCFPLVDGAPYIDGTVDKTRLFASGRSHDGGPADIAVIQLGADAPTSVGRPTFRKYEGGEEALAYGFRGKEVEGVWRSHPDGEWVNGEIMGRQPGGRAQLDGLRTTGAVVEKGFSGGGVYVRARDSVVGMIVESDRDKEKQIAQFIDVPTLQSALGEQSALTTPATLSSGWRRPDPPAAAADTEKKLREIEEYLRRIGEALPAPSPDKGLLFYVKRLLKDEALRAGFGLPRDASVAGAMSRLVSSGEPSAQPFLAILAQRVYHLLWRFESTLKYIPGDWPKEPTARSLALRAICEPHVVARRPTLHDISEALRLSKDLGAFTESAPDPTLYAVLRSFDEGASAASSELSPEATADHQTALDFLYDYLSELLSGERQIDDSSNAWWAVRTGIWIGDRRFSDLLPKVANKYYDIIVPPERVSRLAAVPEIYNAVRTTSYTLSNVQAILERERGLDEIFKGRLRSVIYRMLDRLLQSSRHDQLYLASVHHEGLRNYLDYLKDRSMP